MRITLKDLAEDEGFEDVQPFLEHYALKSVVPGVCPCGYVNHRLEPDQSEGWCESCESTTCVSILVLEGWI